MVQKPEFVEQVVIEQEDSARNPCFCSITGTWGSSVLFRIGGRDHVQCHKLHPCAHGTRSGHAAELRLPLLGLRELHVGRDQGGLGVHHVVSNGTSLCSVGLPCQLGTVALDLSVDYVADDERHHLMAALIPLEVALSTPLTGILPDDLEPLSGDPICVTHELGDLVDVIEGADRDILHSSFPHLCGMLSNRSRANRLQDLLSEGPGSRLKLFQRQEFWVADREPSVEKGRYH